MQVSAQHLISAGAPTEKFYQCKCGTTRCGLSGKACGLCSGVCAALTIGVICLMVFVGGAGLAQQSLDSAGVDLHTMSIKNFGKDGFDAHLVGSMDNRSPLAATMHELQTTMYYDGKAIGTMPMPEQTMPAHAATALELEQRVTVSDAQRGAFAEFSAALLADTSVSLELRGEASVSAAGLSFSGLSMQKEVSLTGFQNFADPAPQVLNSKVVGATPDTVSLELEIVLTNTASVEMLGLGTLNFTLWTAGECIGFATAKDADLKFGSNSYTASATMTRTKDPKQNTAMLALLSNYSSGNTSVVEMRGAAGAGNPDLLVPALAKMVTHGELPGIAPMMLMGLDADFSVPPPTDAGCAKNLGDKTQTGYFDIDFVLQNVLDVPLTVTKTDLDAYWIGTHDLRGDATAEQFCKPASVVRVLNGFSPTMELNIPARSQTIFRQRMCDVSGTGTSQEVQDVYQAFIVCMMSLAGDAQQKGQPFVIDFHAIGSLTGCLGGKDGFCADLKYTQALIEAMNVPKASGAMLTELALARTADRAAREAALVLAEGACSADDAAKSSTVKFSCDAVGCAKKSFFKLDGTAKCLQTATGVSAACATCFGKVAQCALKHCALKCLTDPTAPACQACGHEACDAEAKECTGLSTLPPDAKDCSSALVV